MRFAVILLWSLVSVPLSAAVSSAETRSVSSAPWERSCSSFASAREFVRESSYHCLRQQHQKRCEHRAREFFEKCRYHGDYERISARIHAKMLFVFALATSGPVAEGRRES
jgi:hypothetical protein